MVTGLGPHQSSQSPDYQPLKKQKFNPVHELAHDYVINNMYIHAHNTKA